IATAQELGKLRGIDAVFAGHLKVTNPQPGGGLAGLVSPHLDATVRLDLTVRLLSTRSGATLWRSSAWATDKVGQVGLVDGQLFFGAKDPKQAYGRMVNRLVELVTEDLRPTWRQPERHVRCWCSRPSCRRHRVRPRPARRASRARRPCSPGAASGAWTPCSAT